MNNKKSEQNVNYGQNFMGIAKTVHIIIWLIESAIIICESIKIQENFCGQDLRYLR